jgi:hypothetical protein
MGKKYQICRRYSGENDYAWKPPTFLAAVVEVWLGVEIRRLALSF